MSAIENAKSLHVVFERKKIVKDLDYNCDFVKRTTVDDKLKEIEKLNPKKALQKKLDAIRGDHQRKTEARHVIITNLIEAIKDSNTHEDAVTEKFVDNVECMMHRFNQDLDKLQKIYSNVMKKLPKI